MNVMKILIAISLFGGAQLSHADEDAIKSAKVHLQAVILHSGLQDLEKAKYALKVRLMPGHAFLEGKYLDSDDPRGKGALVARDKLIAAIAKRGASPERKNYGLKKGLEMLGKLEYEPVEINEGQFITDPTDPVRTPDGKLHFTIKKDDVLLKISQPRSDFLLLQLRQERGTWIVVSEYLD